MNSGSSRLLRWSRWWRHSAYSFPVALLMAAALLGLSEFASRRADQQLERATILAQARGVLTTVVRRVGEAESAERGYLLTQDEMYLRPYANARGDVTGGIDRLHLLYRQAGMSNMLPQLRALETNVRTKLDEMDQVLRLHRGGRGDDALALLRSGIGEEHMQRVREELDRLIEAQGAVAAQLRGELQRTLLWLRLGLAIIVTTGLLLMALLLRQSREMEAEREAREELLRHERDRLEGQVSERTAELTELATHLQSAREDERARLARDLHDELGALLTAAKLDVARIRPKLPKDNPDLTNRFAHLTETLNSGIALKRRIIEDLRPSTLSNLGLVPALEILCREFGDRLGAPVEAQLEKVRLKPSAELTVFRMVQEALTNVGKYADAGKVVVTLTQQDGQARISVRDDGRGFDASRRANAAHGLLGMRYRIEAEGGSLAIISAPGQGSLLTASLPVAPEPPEAPATGHAPLEASSL